MSKEQTHDESIDSDLTNISFTSDSNSNLFESTFENISPIFCSFSPILRNKPKQTNSLNYSLFKNSNSISSMNFKETFSTNKKFIFSKNDNINNTIFPDQINKNKSIHNTIVLEKIISGIDNRTTLMIKNIPNKYSLKSFTDELAHKFKNKYDVFYLPIDYSNNNSNLGFAFINFIHPLHIVEFYETFNCKKWKRFSSEKICELAYAKIQGKQNLISHFEKGVFMNCQAKDKKPLILDIIAPFPKITLNIKYKKLFKQTYPNQSYHYHKSKQYITINYFN